MWQLKSWAWDLTSTSGSSMLGRLAVFTLLTLTLNPVTRVTSTLSLTDIEKPGIFFDHFCTCCALSIATKMTTPINVFQCQFRMWTDFKARRQCCLVMSSLRLAGATSSLSSGSKTTPPSPCTGTKYIHPNIFQSCCKHIQMSSLSYASKTMPPSPYIKVTQIYPLVLDQHSILVTVDSAKIRLKWFTNVFLEYYSTGFLCAMSPTNFSERWTMNCKSKGSPPGQKGLFLFNIVQSRGVGGSNICSKIYVEDFV